MKNVLRASLFPSRPGLPGCAWVLIGGVAGVLCLAQPEEQRANAPSVVVTASSRLPGSPASIGCTLVDAEGDACAVTVEVAVDAGAAGKGEPR